MNPITGQQTDICKTSSGKVIRGIIFKPEGGAKTYPTIIFCHGLSADYRMFEYHGRGFAERGICCVMFDFCGGGNNSTSDGATTDMSVKTEAGDLKAVLKTVKKYDFVDKDRIFLLGESQGGYVTADVAYDKKRDVSGLILWYPGFVIPDAVKEMCRDGIPEEYEIFGMRIGSIYARDAINGKPYSRMKRYKRPVLIIHGDCDETVPIEYSYRAQKTYPNVRLKVISNAGHGFEGADRDYARKLSGDFVDMVGRKRPKTGLMGLTKKFIKSKIGLYKLLEK